MLGIIFLCEGQSSTCSHYQQCVYLSRSSHWCWACCTKKLFSTFRVKILQKYLWQCTFFSKVACWRPEAWLKLTSFTGDFKGFCPQIQRATANFRKAFWRTLFLQNTSCWLFSIFQIIYESFESISILFWHSTSQQVSGIVCCFFSCWTRLTSQFMFLFSCQEIAHAY